MKYLLGIDLGSSSVKVSLVDAESGRCAGSASAPGSEAPIKALRLGWAEQSPDDWWRYLKEALAMVRRHLACEMDIAAIGISYQMHGLVCVDKDMRVLRDAIIWCDSRGVPYGEHAPLPGNFTAAKLAWVKEHEPALFDRIRYIMLPGDWLALRLTGTAATTACGLSEMMLWDFERERVSEAMMNYFGFREDIIPPLVPTFGEQGRVSASAAAELGITAGIPVAYRAGDQPNNALSLAVLNPGEVAATAGTSGVVYGVVESGKRKVESVDCVNALMRECVSADAPATNAITQSHNNAINIFLHVNHYLGVMHCVNGCGIMNAWMKRQVAPTATYDEINSLAAKAPEGCDGLTVIPFGNGAERVLLNRNVGASIHGIDLNRHGQAHLLRAAQEGVAFAMMYGMEKMGAAHVIRAGRANMFLSPLFRQTLADVSGATIELYDTDGSIGAARGAGLSAGIYATPKEAFASLQLLGTTEPRPAQAVADAWQRWKSILDKQ